MVSIAIRILVFAATAYFAVLAILFLFQSSFIFPAPSGQYDPSPGFRSVQYQAEDGLTHTAHWRRADPGRPTVVWFHGNGGSLAGAAVETRVLAEAGYGVLLASYRGYGGNPGAPSETGFYRDGRAAMGFLAANGIAPEQTIIAGHSIGSGTAVQMASEYAPAALMLVAPFTSLTDAASDALPIFPVRYLLRHDFDNAAKIGALTMPILIMHGSRDKVVPFNHGQKLAAQSEQAHFIPFDGADHDLSYWQEAQTEQANWLAELGF